LSASAGKTAVIPLQENSAVAVVDISRAEMVAVKPLGYKDHGVPGFGLNVSDEDGAPTRTAAPPR
jgi:hypothetical protein